MDNVDELIEKRIKFGRCHLTILLVLFLVNFAVGAHEAVIKFVFNKILKT